MYKQLTRDDWIKTLRLPNDYSVDGILIYGSGNKQKQYEALALALKEFKVTENINLEFEFFGSVKVLIINGKRIWFDIVYGSSYLSELLHVGCTLGSKQNIFLGSCGGLVKGGKSGDIIIPEYSFGDESSTRMYSKNNIDNRYYPNKQLSTKIFQMTDKKYKIWKGPLITCQAMLAETWEDVLRWSNENYYGVEMETATFFALSNHFNVASAALLYITDNLIEREIVNSDSHVNAKSLRNEVRAHNYKLALKSFNLI